MPAGVQQPVPLETAEYGGFNNVLQFSQLPRSQSPSMKNAWMSKIKSIGKRPGTIPLTTSALASSIGHLATYKSSASSSASEELYASSGTTLSKFNGTTAFTALTMTNILNSSDIFTVGFTNASLVSRLMIGDGASLKACDGSAVANVTPAANDPSPAPANSLSSVNTKGCKYVWEYSGHVFISPGTNEVFYTKRNQFDYVPATQFFYLVNDNDFVNGCGVAFDNVCLIPMRRGWNIVTGTTFDNFDSSKFLNSAQGVISDRSIAKITYPDGTQTIAYLSDDGVQEIFIAIMDGGGRVYATRSLMKEKVDFAALGLTDSEKGAAIGYFDAEYNVYLLTFQKAGVSYTYAYDVRNREWYPNWMGFDSQAFMRFGGVLTFADGGHLCKFDADLYSDWADRAQASGTPVHFQRYSPLIYLEQSGYSSYWDYYLVEARQWLVPSTLDVSAIFTNNSETDTAEAAWKNSIAVYDVSQYDIAAYANLEYTDIVNAPNRFRYKKKAKYVQALWDNPRDEPVLIFWEKWLGRTSDQ